MTLDEFKEEVLKLGAIAKKQREGAYTTESDAVCALELFIKLCILLQEVR